MPPRKAIPNARSRAAYTPHAVALVWRHGARPAGDTYRHIMAKLREGVRWTHYADAHALAMLARAAPPNWTAVMAGCRAVGTV